MSSDLTFLTNDPGSLLLDRFRASLGKNTRFVDCLADYFFITGFYDLYPSISATPDYLCCYMNSFSSLRMSGGYFQFKAPQLRVMPLRVSGIDQPKFVRMVKRILAAKCTDTGADTSKLEAEIDRLVDKLHGLTDDEIAIVENTSR